MRARSGGSWLLALLLFLGGACGDDERSVTAPASTAATSAPSARTLDGETPISFHGIGPIRAGMTVAEAENAAGRRLVVTDFEQFEGRCYFAHPEGMRDDVILTVLSPGDAPVSDPMDGIIGRASFEEAVTTSPSTTANGVGLGASPDDVRAAYAGHTISESKHHYVDGTYLDVEAPNGDLMLRFEVGDEGTVFAIHGGTPRAVTLVEGCA